MTPPKTDAPAVAAAQGIGEQTKDDTAIVADDGCLDKRFANVCRE